MRERPRAARPPDHVLLHPWWLVALAVLVVNDHVLKGAGVLPGWLTGKLSDVAGLVVAPGLLAVALRARGRRALVACHLAVGFGFALLKVSPEAALAWSRTLSWLLPSRLWCDPSDLVALPALGASWWLSARAPRGAARDGEGARGFVVERDRGRKLVAAALGLFGCVATSRAPEPPVAPRGRMLYVPKYGEGVYVVDPKTGRLRGKLEDDLGLIGWGDTVFRPEGRQIVAIEATTRQKRVVASEPGRALWPIAADEARLYAVATGPRGDSDAPGYLMAFDRARGTKLWVGQERLEARRYDLDGDWIFAQSWARGEGTLVAVDAKTGARRWAHPFGDRPAAAPALAGDLVLLGVGTYDEHGTLRAIDASSGRTRWSFQTEGPAAEVGAGEGLAVVKGYQAIEVVDLATGQKRWGAKSAEKGRALSARPVEGILVSALKDTLRGVRIADGSEAWQTKLDDFYTATASPSANEGIVYVRAYSGELVAIEAKTGKVLWRLGPDAKPAGPPGGG